MFHRIIFLLLIVSSLSCNFNRCAVCFQSFMNIACRSTQNAARIKRFLRLHIVIKPLNKKINTINSLLCWGVTLLMFIQTLYNKCKIPERVSICRRFSKVSHRCEAKMCGLSLLAIFTFWVFTLMTYNTRFVFETKE